MKHVRPILVMLSLLGTSVPAFAETPADHGQEIIKLKMGDLVLPFSHWRHQKILNDECTACHATKVGRIDGWSKETAHTLCISCHDSRRKGPVECQECHNIVYSQK